LYHSGSMVVSSPFAAMRLTFAAQMAQRNCDDHLRPRHVAGSTSTEIMRECRRDRRQL
jgi:hypothetical protein